MPVISLLATSSAASPRQGRTPTRSSRNTGPDRCGGVGRASRRGDDARNGLVHGWMVGGDGAGGAHRRYGQRRAEHPSRPHLGCARGGVTPGRLRPVARRSPPHPRSWRAGRVLRARPAGSRGPLAGADVRDAGSLRLDGARPHRFLESNGRGAHTPAPERLRAGWYHAVRHRCSRAGHRARDRSRARHHVAGGGPGVRRQPHLYERGARRAGVGCRHQRGRAGVGQPVRRRAQASAVPGDASRRLAPRRVRQGRDPGPHRGPRRRRRCRPCGGAHR